MSALIAATLAFNCAVPAAVDLVTRSCFAAAVVSVAAALQ